MATRKVLIVLGPEGKQASDRTFLEQFCRFSQGGMKAELEPDQHLSVESLESLLKFRHALKGMGERLFQQDVTSGFGKWYGRIKVQGGWIGNNDGIRLRVQSTADVCFNRQATQLIIRRVERLERSRITSRSPRASRLCR